LCQAESLAIVPGTIARVSIVADSGETTGLKYQAPTVNTVIDAAGDLLYGTAADTLGRLAIGTAGQILQVNSGATAPEWATPAGGGGKVLQVVYGSYATEQTSTTTTFADTGLSASITPSSATSKVLVLVSQQGVYKANDNNGNGTKLRLLRGGTAILDPISTISPWTGTLLEQSICVSTCYLDSPSTTSATTYKTQFARRAAGGTVKVQFDSGETSTIILMEIGA
jgi:hypothetical protein